MRKKKINIDKWLQHDLFRVWPDFIVIGLLVRHVFFHWWNNCVNTLDIEYNQILNIYIYVFYKNSLSTKGYPD